MISEWDVRKFANAAKEAGWKDNDLFYLEDKQLIEGLKIMSTINS